MRRFLLDTSAFLKRNPVVKNLLFSATAAILCCQSAHAAQVPDLQKMYVSGGRANYVLEVARTEAAAEKGLMHRTHLAPKTGMAFPFNPPKTAIFWMKNTFIPLDMIFIRNHRIIRILENVPPCSPAESKQDQCSLYTSIVPVDWVLELPAGTAKTDKLKKNQHLKFKFK